MSIDSNFKSIAESLKSIDGTLQNISTFLKETGGPIEVTPVETQAAPEVPKETPPEKQQQPSQEQPLTADDLNALNSWLGDVANYLGDSGADQIRGVMNQHGLGTLADLGADRQKLTAFSSDIQNLKPQGAA